MEQEQILERASWLVRSQSERVKLQEEMQRVFTLDWNEDALKNKPDWVKEVKDPQPFNAMQWLVDVMAHDEPQYQIEIPEGALPKKVGGMPQMPMMDPAQMPMDLMRGMMPPMPGMGGMGVDPAMQEMLGGVGVGGDEDDSEERKEMGDMLEKTVQEIFRQNDQRMPTSLQRDELYPAFVSGMIVDKIGDLRLSQGNKWQTYAGRHRGSSPFTIKSVNPAHVYFEHDEYGVCEVFQRYLRPLKEVMRLYGGKVPGLANVKANDNSGLVLFCEYWTEDKKAAWVERVYTTDYTGDENNFFRGDDVIQACYFVTPPEVNSLGFIPYSVKVARGTSVFNRQNMVYPHLYSATKSKLITRNNLYFTVAATLAFMLVNPQWTQETDTPENPIQLDFSTPNVIGVKKGDKLTPLPVNITPEFKDMMTLFAQKIEESTVSKVIAGQDPGGVTAASGINLLIGGGKLTVSSVQKAMGEVRATTVDRLLEYIRAYKEFDPLGKPGLEMYSGGRFNEIDPASLPDRIDIRVHYQPFMPQDRALAVQTWLEPLMQEIISSDFFAEQTGIQDVVTLRRQIEQDQNRKLAAQQVQQQVQVQQQEAMMMQQQQAAMAQQQAMPDITQGANAEDVGMGEQPLEGVMPNPQAPNANPAGEINAMLNAISNPMTQ
jgi:hypothetical protein